ncbi:MAG: DHHA1 domain-containing protein [bacterium]|nr:DHHA1 domain-containing protein [bacterium]MDY2830022.1 DHHA1 domain-containing protein [Alphaproteobacteria bacterium]
MLCIYHLADHDGKGSAAIVGRKFKNVVFYGLNHDSDVPEDLIAAHDKIIVCDISLPLDMMFKLNETKDLTWIDHHVSTIDAYREAVKNGAHEIAGVRQEDTAAIMLTWRYFFPDEPVPEGVKLLALNDIFDLSDKRVRPFEYAFQSLGVNKPEDKNWKDLFAGKIDIDEMVKKGEAILSYIKNRNHRLCKAMSFESSYMGYKCICANMPQGYSEFYDGLKNVKDYDFMCNFFMNGKNTWNLSLYTSKDTVDVSKIAASLGGGGHKKAAGASGLKKLPEFLHK